MQSLRLVSASLLIASLAGLTSDSATASAATTLVKAGETQWVYFGTFTNAKSRGIYVSRLDLASGKLTPPELAAEFPNPAFLALHPNKKFLYAVSEIGNFQGKKAGAVNAFALDAASGKLTLLNQESSGGDGPCHLTVDRSGKTVLVANYAGGSIAALPIHSDGRVGPAATFIQHTGSSVNPQRQKEPHAHMAVTSPDNRFAIFADLGLDKLMVYRLNPAKAELTPNEPPFIAVAPGNGPRHFAFHPNGKWAYVINEMLCSVIAFEYDARRGALKEAQTISTLPAGEPVRPSYSTAELQVHPNGKFLYGSNRGHNSVVVFAIDESNGRLALVEHVATQGRTPRSFGIAPTGRWLLAANQGSDNVVVFSLDPQTGKLTLAGQTVEVGAPVCVEFVPAK